MKKFRVWDGERYDYLEKHSSWSSFWDKNDPTNVEELVFEQSTGLKDKNGVEIFEGDIIKCVHSTGEEVVSYVTEREEFGGVGFFANDSSFGHEGEDLLFLAESEVIGNINENSNLL